MHPFTILWQSPAVENVLRCRGQVIARQGDRSKTLWPVGVEPIPGSNWDYRRDIEWFRLASLRKIVQRLALGQGTPVSQDVLRRMVGPQATRYSDQLVALGVAEALPEGLRLKRIITDIGPSLEFYIAVLCQQELSGIAVWGARLKDLKPGGDYDILASLPPLLVYIEAKASEPSNIKDRSLRLFLARAEALSPDIAILLVDTQDSLDSLISRLNNIMRPPLERALAPERNAWGPLPIVVPEPDFEGINFGYFRTYVTNSRPSIITKIRRCLQHYYQRAQHLPTGRPVIDFIAGEVIQTPFGRPLTIF